jgi:hypothetical protein
LSAALQTGAGADNGFQFLTPDLSFVGTNFLTYGPTCTRDATFRYLIWLPTAAGAAATITYNGNTVSPADNNNGGWNFYDLESIADLAPGASMDISAVRVAYLATG